MKTVLEILQATTGYFTKSGIESARLNIEHLLAHTLGIKRMELYLQFDRPLSEKELAPLRDLVRRRAQGEPLQHLLGTVEFFGRTFACDRRALIPRPETERLAERILDLLRDKPPRRVADIGTGSGVLALTFAAEWPEADVHAVDVSAPALELACENATSLGLGARVHFHLGSLTAPLMEAAQRAPFDLLVANLPYIPTDEITGLSREVQHDPITALDGGRDGASLIRQLLLDARGILQGCIALEIGHNQGAGLCEALAEAGYHSIRSETDYQGRNRFLFAIHG